MENYTQLLEMVKNKNNLPEVEYQAGDFLFHQAEYEPNLFWIRKGLVKMAFFQSDGKEFVKSFLVENELAGSLLSVVFEKPSPYACICLESSLITKIPYAMIRELTNQSLAMKEIELSFIQQLTARKEDREYQFLCLTPEQRYLTFIEQYPSVYRRISQIELARFLGITPVALSRIKKRCRQKEYEGD